MNLTMFTIELFKAYNEMNRFQVCCESFAIWFIYKAWPSSIDSRFNFAFEPAAWN